MSKGKGEISKLDRGKRHIGMLEGKTTIVKRLKVERPI
jgi:hypothetical protein